MKDISLLLPHIMPYVPGAPRPLVYHHIRNASREMCERCRLWRDEITITIAEPSNALVPSDTTNSEIFEIDEAYYGDNQTPIDKYNEDEADDKHSGWRTDGDTLGTGSFPTGIVERGDNLVTVFPYIDGNVLVKLFVKTSMEATQLPDPFIDQYYEWLAWGAIYRIKLLPEQSYSDPKGGVAFKGLFDEMCDSKSSHHKRGQMRTAPRVKARFF